MDLPVAPETPPGTAALPPRTPISGQYCTLEPLAPAHASSLFSHIAGPSNDHIWTWLPLPNPAEFSTFETHLSNWSASSDPLHYAVTATKNGKKETLGMLTYMSIVPEHRRIEIGWVVLGDELKRTRIATEAFYAMLKRAFDELGYLRVEWKCNSLNKASRSAAERLGFTYEGTFRQHIIVKGRRRDTAWFSIIKDEWPAVREALEKWLSEDNFDEEGKQKKRLQDCR